LYQSEVSKLFANHYVVVDLTVKESEQKKALENPGAEKLLDELGGAQAGLPFYAFLDQSGKKIADSLAMPGGGNIGHPATAEEIKAFEKLLERTAPRMTDAERARITDYLTKSTSRSRAAH
jgi:hypothetical protein